MRLKVCENVVWVSNSLDPDETPSNLCRIRMFHTRTTFSQILSRIEALRKLKQVRNLAEDNKFGGLRIKKELIESKTLFIQRIKLPKYEYRLGRQRKNRRFILHNIS